MAQLRAVHAFDALAACGVQAATPVGPTTVGAGQVVAMKRFAPVAADGEQLAAPVLLLLSRQVVATKEFPEFADALVQDATGTSVVTAGAGQVVVVKLLPGVGPDAEQLATPTLLLTTEPQLVLTQLLPEEAATGLHEADAVGPVLATVQTVCTKLLPDVGATGVQVCTGVMAPTLAPQLV